MVRNIDDQGFIQNYADSTSNKLVRNYSIPRISSTFNIMISSALEITINQRTFPNIECKLDFKLSAFEWRKS